ncbi:SDR family oxidoreductase [Hoeflea alexandrii]|uniref:SDR family oxidoreductase n=1 Tax=Hoeflea alexandrii TaxID=288436 RepID=UPI0022B01E0A|nr:SDR family NAD(P)-dependent oxidoreductase [Hoeflea alexandrii]MCZ4290259.1 SDR family oxidoreductase [Hoeflea alexandrii]
MDSLKKGGLAVVIGSTGGIGAAMADILEQSGAFAGVTGFSRTSQPGINLLDEQSIIRAADTVRARQMDLRLVLDATGFLHGSGFTPEKSLAALTPEHMAHAFAVNAMGPALVMKHFLPLLPKQGKSIFATLSAKVGSIGDNRLGGWYSYRASKAALNQLVHTAAIELARRKPEAVCVALHPGTVDTGLSSDFARTGLKVRRPDQAAALLIGALDRLTPAETGGFFDYNGEPLPW